MITGIDTAARITAAQAEKIKAQGLSFVGRYIVPTMYSKSLTADEAALLHEAGLAILLCWEMGGEDMRRGSAKGAEHGIRARNIAQDMGVPSGAVIYFAADYDVQPGELSLCEQYIMAAQAALGKYQVGVYGGERIITFFAERNHPIALWQCCAWTKKYNDQADVIQYAWQGAADAKAMASALGFAVDLDSCEDLRRAGMWMPTAETSAEPWYTKAMEWAASKGLMNDGRPNDNVTRAELATVLMRYDEKRFSGLLED